MIITVSREFGEDLWRLTITENDGSKVVRNGREVPFQPVSCAHGVIWDEVGRLVQLVNHHEPGVDIAVRYADGNNMIARVQWNKAKKIDVDLPGRLVRWFDDQNLGDVLLTHVWRTARYTDRSKDVLRLTFAMVPGIRRALDQFVALLDGVRIARRKDNDDFQACQLAIGRLDVAYREMRTPWCDTCKQPVVRQEHGPSGGWFVHAEPVAARDHELTVTEWNNT